MKEIVKFTIGFAGAPLIVAGFIIQFIWMIIGEGRGVAVNFCQWLNR